MLLEAAGNSIHYYNAVDTFLRTNTDTKTDEAYRFFPVPGMNQ